VPELIDPLGDGHSDACHLVTGDGRAPDITEGARAGVHH
jgi:hypothetical protein